MHFDEIYPTTSSAVLFADSRKEVVLQDKKGGNVTYRGQNDRGLNIIAYIIDGGIISDSSIQKCDFALYTKDSDILRLIELKGSDLDKACEQISSSIRELLGNNIHVQKLYGRIVLSRAKPVRLESVKVKKLRKHLAEKNGNLKYGTKQLTESID